MNDLRKIRKKILCPFCNRTYEVKSLPSHLDTKHPEDIPEGFTPLQVTYHLYNKYPYDYRKACRVCKRPTSWDENKGRYNFLCDDPNCKKKWIEIMKQRIGNTNPTQTEEGLKKMLASRKISGTYKFTTGGEFTYTGSYELETLKFMDTVLEIKAEDLEVPGPVLHYEFNNQTHSYITDIYYRPYNLIIEVKDGGNNPNKNQAMVITRAKQLAKEKYIIQNTNYNYIRLTDKNFSQLMAVFADLKLNVVDHDNSRVIHVNENMFAGIHGMMLPVPKFSEQRDIVIVNYMKKNTFVNDNDYAICSNPKFDTVFAREDGKLVKTDKSIFEDCQYTPYIVRDMRGVLENCIAAKLGEYVDKNYLYEATFAHPAITDDQIMFESTAERYEDYYKNLKSITESVKEDVYDNHNLIEKRYGIISLNGAYNCCLKVKGYPKPMRGRSSIIILKKFNNKWKAFVRRTFNDRDSITPGGGWNENEDPKDAAIREAKEEVRMNVTKVRHMNYLIEYHEDCAKWVIENVPNEEDRWYGYFTEIFVGIYDSKYTGKVADIDKDDLLYTAKWYPVDYLVSSKSFLPKEYKEAITNYLIKEGEEYNG